MNEKPVTCVCCGKPIEVCPLGLLDEVVGDYFDLAFFHHCAFCGGDMQFHFRPSDGECVLDWAICKPTHLVWLMSLV